LAIENAEESCRSSPKRHQRALREASLYELDFLDVRVEEFTKMAIVLAEADANGLPDCNRRQLDVELDRARSLAKESAMVTKVRAILVVWTAFTGITTETCCVAAQDAAPRVDAFGVPLPDGAIARIGFDGIMRHGWGSERALAVTDDGKFAATAGERERGPDELSKQAIWISASCGGRRRGPAHTDRMAG
jgi:hypothetical protein